MAMTPDQSDFTNNKCCNPTGWANFLSMYTQLNAVKTVLATGGTPLQTYLILFYMKIIVLLLERNCSTIIPKKGGETAHNTG